MNETVPMLPPSHDDRLTVSAIAIVAACIVTVDHEALGHGSLCVGLGGQVALLTSVYFRCTIAREAIAAAGPAANLLISGLAWLALRMVPPRLSAPGLLLVFILAFGMFWEAGYLLYSVLTGEGDWAVVAQAASGPTPWLWKPGGIVVSLLLYVVAIRATSTWIYSWIDLSTAEAAHRARALFRTAWMAACVSAALAAAAYAPHRLRAVRQALLEIGGASIPLLLMPVWDSPITTATPAVLQRSHAWISIAVVVYAIFVATLGRGVG